MLNIIPVSSNIGSIGGLGPIGGGPNVGVPAKEGAKTFSDFFTDALQEVESLDAKKQDDAYRLAVGEIDDIAQLGIDSTKSEIAVQMMVQIRNKLLDAYSEIMRINI